MKQIQCTTTGCYNTATCRDGKCTRHTRAAASGKRPYSHRREPKTNAPHLGIEIECLARNTDSLHSMMAQRLIPSSDSSLGHDEYGCEYKMLGPTPVIIKRAASFVGRLQNLGATINSKCGLHVHLDCREQKVRSESDSRIEGGCSAGWKFVEWLQKWEHTFQAMMPRSRNLERNDYLKPIESGCNRDHYQWAHYTSYHTVEIRIHPGTLNPFKVEGWLWACHDLMRWMRQCRNEPLPEVEYQGDTEQGSGMGRPYPPRIVTTKFLSKVFTSPLALAYVLARLVNNGELRSFNSTINGPVEEAA